MLVAAVVLEAGDAEEALAAHVAGELGEAVRGVPGGHVLVEVQLKLNRCWFSFLSFVKFFHMIEFASEWSYHTVRD